MRSPFRHSPAQLPAEPSLDEPKPLSVEAAELGALDAAHGVPDPAAETVVPGRRQPPANIYVLAEKGISLMKKAKRSALLGIGAGAEKARSLPIKLALVEGQRRRITAALEERSHGRRSLLVLFGLPLVALPLVLAAPVEVALFESALRFTDLAEPTLRLIAVGTVVAFEAALLVALRHGSTSGGDAPSVREDENQTDEDDVGDIRKQAL